MGRPRPSKLRARRFALLAGVLALGVSEPIRASFEFGGPSWDSASAFLALARQELGKDRVVLDARVDWAVLTEKDALLLLHPTTPVDAAEASAFVSAGGRLAIVDDFGSGAQLLSRFHIQRAIAPKPPGEAYRDNPHLAIARPVETPSLSGGKLKHPMVAGVDRVVTNHPSAYATAPHVELTPVLTLGDTAGNAELFAVIGVIGDGSACGLDDGTPDDPEARCGRLFAMADSSVFIDLMLQFEGNRALAKGLLHYLVESDSWGERQGKLYIVANDFDQSGQFGGGNDPARELDRMLESVLSLVEEIRNDGLPKEWAWLLAILAVLGTGLFAWRSSGKPYQRHTPRYARAQPLTAQAGAAGRAAVLAAPTTDATLVLLELKVATEEYLRRALGLERTASGSAILETIALREALGRTDAERLRELFGEMARAEKALLGAESLRIRTESIKQMHEHLARILPRVKASP